jgi:hypothetical protein
MCAAVMMAKDRDKHRDQHIAGLGITQVRARRAVVVVLVCVRAVGGG